LRRRSDSAPSVTSVVGSAGVIPIRSTNRERRWRRDDDPLKTLAKTLIFPPRSQAPVRISKFLCAPLRIRLAYPPSKANVNAGGGSLARIGSSGSCAIVGSRSSRRPPKRESLVVRDDDGREQPPRPPPRELRQRSLCRVRASIRRGTAKTRRMKLTRRERCRLIGVVRSG